MIRGSFSAQWVLTAWMESYASVASPRTALAVIPQGGWGPLPKNVSVVVRAVWSATVNFREWKKGVNGKREHASLSSGGVEVIAFGPKVVFRGVGR